MSQNENHKGKTGHMSYRSGTPTGLEEILYETVWALSFIGIRDTGTNLFRSRRGDAGLLLAFQYWTYDSAALIIAIALSSVRLGLSTLKVDLNCELSNVCEQNNYGQPFLHHMRLHTNRRGRLLPFAALQIHSLRWLNDYNLLASNRSTAKLIFKYSRADAHHSAMVAHMSKYGKFLEIIVISQTC